MDLQDDEATEQQAESMPGLDSNDPLTYDPTQGPGTDMWRLSKRVSAERNAREGM